MTNEERDKLIMEIHSAVHTMKEQVADHKRTLYGNGQPGICTRLQKLEDGHENERNNTATFISILMAVTALIGVVYTIIR